MTSRSGGELPQLELDCLAALWELGPAPVAQVRTLLERRGRPLAYTTVLTVLDRLRRKQAAERRRHGRAFIYAPLLTREAMRQRAVERLLRNYFDSRQDMEAWLRREPSPAPPAAIPQPVDPLFLD